MKVQLFSNYEAGTRNYRSNTNINQPTKTNLQSFGKVIIDNRGIDKVVGRDLKKLLRTTLRNLKRIMDPKLMESTEKDILIYPFQSDMKLGGIAVYHPYDKGVAVTKFYSDEALDAETIKDHIKDVIPEATTFKKVASETMFPDYLLDTEKKLPVTEVKKRFNRAA